VRLAVLGACEGGRRDQVNAWTGVVPALTRAGIPAVVGMQYKIRDKNAIVFSRRFYRALAAGQPIDAAVTDGRLAILNRSGDDERDWGVPVLYLRTGEGVLFPRTRPTRREDDSQTERALLEAELAQHRRNLLRLRQQRAIYAEGEVPLRLLNQIEAEEQVIEQVQARLAPPEQ
jgi:hypothetical protein